MTQKIMLNALRMERFDKLSIKERGNLVRRIRKVHKLSYRKLTELTGIPHSTLLDWETGRQINTGANIHISLALIVRKLKEYEPQGWVEIEMFESIKKIVTIKLKNIKEMKNKEKQNGNPKKD